MTVRGNVRRVRGWKTERDGVSCLEESFPCLERHDARTSGLFSAGFAIERDGDGEWFRWNRRWNYSHNDAMKSRYRHRKLTEKLFRSLFL